jgi:hypothetical protein
MHKSVCIRGDKYDIINEAKRVCDRWRDRSLLLKISELTSIVEDFEAIRIENKEQNESLRQLRNQLNRATLVQGKYIDGHGRTVVRKIISQDTSKPESNSDDEVSEHTDYNDSASRAHSDGWFYED